MDSIIQGARHLNNIPTKLCMGVVSPPVTSHTFMDNIAGEIIHLPHGGIAIKATPDVEYIYWKDL